MPRGFDPDIEHENRIFFALMCRGGIAGGLK